MSLIDPETGEEWPDKGEYLIHLLNSLSADMIYGNEASIEAYISKFDVLDSGICIRNSIPRLSKSMIALRKD